MRVKGERFSHAIKDLSRYQVPGWENLQYGWIREDGMEMVVLKGDQFFSFHEGEAITEPMTLSGALDYMKGEES